MVDCIVKNLKKTEYFQRFREHSEISSFEIEAAAKTENCKKFSSFPAIPAEMIFLIVVFVIALVWTIYEKLCG